MDVYEFEKCLLDRLEESMEVLSWKDEVISSSQVRLEWSCYIELQIEPVGWQALWKIPRVICEEMHLRFPTVVFGMVEQVLFKEMKAIFLILAVQDEDVHLPERQEVNLVDLWATKIQENTELNVEKTADCIDRLRFFYNYVWMPWDYDNDEDLNWVEKHLESRIRFCYDLRKKDMKRALAAHIRTLLAEAKYLQERREYLEIGLSDDEELDDTLDKSQITDLMRLHLRLNMIKSEIEMLENPEVRKIYEEVKFDDKKSLKTVSATRDTEKHETEETVKNKFAYIVTMPFSIEKQITFLEMIKQLIDKDCSVQMCPSLQDVLNICNASDDIFLSPGNHSIKFLEYLNDNGSISGLTKEHVANTSADRPSEEDVVLRSPDDDSILLVFDGNFTIKNISLDCRNVRSGILIKSGEITLKNCKIIGDGKSSTQQGIACSGNSNIVMDDCTVENFSTGLVAGDTTSITLRNCKIMGCRIGIDVDSPSARVHFENTQIITSVKCGLYFETSALNNKADGTRLLLNDPNDLQQYCFTELPWSGECYFLNCGANAFVLNKKNEVVFPKTLECILCENEGNSREGSTILRAKEEIKREFTAPTGCEVIILDDSVIEINCDE